MTTALGIIAALLGIAYTGWRWWVGRQAKKEAERERALGRLQQGTKQADADRKALARAKEIKDNVEKRGSGQLRDSLGRWVRKP
jgi:predicted negative regulator of RcsB-dependent stress response